MCLYHFHKLLAQALYKLTVYLVTYIIMHVEEWRVNYCSQCSRMVSKKLKPN